MGVAMVLWPGYYDPMGEWMCATEDICGAPGPKAKLAMTCDECLGGIQASVEQMLSEEFMMGLWRLCLEKDSVAWRRILSCVPRSLLSSSLLLSQPWLLALILQLEMISATWLSLTLVWLKLLYKKYTRISYKKK